MDPAVPVKLFVGGLPSSANDHDLWLAFSYFVPVVSATVELSKILGISRCFGYVEIASQEYLTTALTTHIFVHGTKVDVQLARPAKMKLAKPTTPKTKTTEKADSGKSTCFQTLNYALMGPCAKTAHNGKMIASIQAFNPDYLDLLCRQENLRSPYLVSTRPIESQLQVSRRLKRKKINWLRASLQMDESPANYRFNWPQQPSTRAGLPNFYSTPRGLTRNPC